MLIISYLLEKTGSATCPFEEHAAELNIAQKCNYCLYTF